MAEINAEREKMVEENGGRLRDSALAAIFFNVDFEFSIMCGPLVHCAREKFAGKTLLKIAQSGHRLDHGYSVDGRSG